MGGVTWGSIRTVSELHEGMDIAVSLPSPSTHSTIQHISAQINISLLGWKEGRKEGLLSVCLGFLAYKMKNSPSLILKVIVRVK